MKQILMRYMFLVLWLRAHTIKRKMITEPYEDLVYLKWQVAPAMWNIILVLYSNHMITCTWFIPRSFHGVSILQWGKKKSPKNGLIQGSNLPYTFVFGFMNQTKEHIINRQVIRIPIFPYKKTYNNYRLNITFLGHLHCWIGWTQKIETI